MKGLIQIAGIIDSKEAQMLIEMGIHHLGFPLRLVIPREDLTEKEAANIIHSLNLSKSGVLITYLENANEILDFSKMLGVEKVQLHADIPSEEVAVLRELDSGIYILKSLVVREDNFSELKNAIEAYSSHVNAFITDTYDPETGAYGATGKTHNWDISRQLVKMSPRPIMLAGGLKPENVYDAILHVRPAGVDAHTGVERSDGRKDRRLVGKFVEEANKAFKLIS